MPARADFSAELILVCNSLDAGGIECVTTLANEWSRRGLYGLDPKVRAQPSPSPAHH